MIDASLGMGPQSLEGPDLLSASLSAFTMEIFQTPTLDLTKTYADVEIIPARPGFVPFLASANLNRWLIESITGTQTTPPTIRAGNDAGHSNFVTSTATTPSNAAVNAASPPSQITGPSAAAVTAKRFPGATVYFDLTSAAVGTGGYACRAKYTCAVIWVAVE